MKKKEIKVMKVDFSGGYENALAVYVDGILYRHCTSYPTTLHLWYDGFVDGLEHAGVWVDTQFAYAQDWDLINKVYELGEEPPHLLSLFEIGSDFPDEALQVFEEDEEEDFDDDGPCGFAD